MVPSNISVIPKLPLTHNGKVDRNEIKRIYGSRNRNVHNETGDTEEKTGFRKKD